MKFFAFIITAAFIFAFSWKSDTPFDNDYFPVKKASTLVYESSFGECRTKNYQKENLTISASLSDKFKYKQSFVIQDSGVYVKETYQFLRILGLFNKEVTITYKKPLLRFPLPLTPGIKWHSEGIEYQDGEENTVKISGKCSGMEFIQTKAGKFEAIKVETIVEGSNGSKNNITEWYVKGVGLIKAKIIIEGGGITGTLRDLLGYGVIEFNLKEIKQ